jgi:hypothetical protein
MAKKTREFSTPKKEIKWEKKEDGIEKSVFYC